MKPLLILVSIAFSACSTPASRVQLTIGVPQRGKRVSALVEFPAKITNHSKQSVWYHGNMGLKMPYYRAFTRPSHGGEWSELPYWQCGMGAGEFEIPAGATAEFHTVAPAHDRGDQYQVELSIYKSGGGQAKPFSIRSEPVIIP